MYLVQKEAVGDMQTNSVCEPSRMDLGLQHFYCYIVPGIYNNYGYILMFHCNCCY